MNNKIYLAKVDLPELREQVVSKEKEIQATSTKLQTDFADISEKIKLPKEVIKRYEKNIEKPQFRLIFQRVILLYVLIFIFLVFFQPSLFLSMNNGTMELDNLSFRDISDVSVTRITNTFYAVPVEQITVLHKKEKVSFSPNGDGLYIVTAKNQLPWILYHAKEIDSESPVNPLQEQVNKG